MAAVADVDPRDHEPLLLRTLCDRGAKLQPDNLIITKTAAGYHTITYKEHQAASLQLANALDRWGVRIGDRVATLMWNTAWHLQCYHAISCMGAVLHTLNLRLGPKDLGYIIQHANDRILFCDADLLELLSKVDEQVLAKVELFVCLGTDGVAGQWTLPAGIPASRTQDYHTFLATGRPEFRWPDLPETALHALCYTSGTTGFPKGAAYSQRSTFLHTVVTSGVDFVGASGSDVLLAFVPMFHVLSWGIPYQALMLGARLVFTSRFMDPETMLGCMADWRVSMSFGVPTVWQGLRAAVERIERRGAREAAELFARLKLRALVCGGSSPPPEMMRWYKERLGVDFVQVWGMTETNPLGSMARHVAKYADLAKPLEQQLVNIGKAGLPLPGVELRIADAADLDRDVAQGQPGELLVWGPWIIGRYFQVDAKDKFHKGWLITGDVAKIDEEGALVISDRSKDVVKSGGEWISSIDMENHIAAMDGIAMAAVVAVPHPRWDERPVAVVTLAAGASTANLVDRVQQHCLSAFAKFQLPDDVLVWEQLPLTSTGKLDKKVIRDRLTKEGYVLPSLRNSTSKL